MTWLNRDVFRLACTLGELLDIVCIFEIVSKIQRQRIKHWNSVSGPKDVKGISTCYRLMLIGVV